LQTLSGSLQTSFSPDEVNNGLTACKEALSTVTLLAKQGYLNGIPASTITTIATTLSSFVSKEAALVSASDSSKATGLDVQTTHLQEGVLTTLSDGQSPFSLISDNFQSSLGKQRLDDSQGKALIS
jgi:hypothetical protein